MILVMLLLVLTIVRGTGGDLYVILLIEGRGGGGGRFVPPSNKRMTQKITASAGGYICIARQWRFLVFYVVCVIPTIEFTFTNKNISIKAITNWMTIIYTGVQIWKLINTRMCKNLLKSIPNMEKRKRLDPWVASSRYMASKLLGESLQPGAG